MYLNEIYKARLYQAYFLHMSKIFKGSGKILVGKEARKLVQDEGK